MALQKDSISVGFMHSLKKERISVAPDTSHTNITGILMMTTKSDHHHVTYTVLHNHQLVSI